MTEENCIWKAKCLRFGWTLPSPPLPTDMGTWKRHYLGCVINLHWVPPSPAKVTSKLNPCRAQNKWLVDRNIITDNHWLSVGSLERIVNLVRY